VNELDLIKKLEIHRGIQDKIVSAFMNCFHKRLFSYKNSNIFYKVKRDKTKENTEYVIDQIDVRVKKMIDYIHNCGVKSFELRIEMGDIDEPKIKKKLNKRKQNTATRRSI